VSGQWGTNWGSNQHAGTELWYAATEMLGIAPDTFFSCRCAKIGSASGRLLQLSPTHAVQPNSALRLTSHSRTVGSRT
jgi:hypothetical protein